MSSSRYIEPLLPAAAGNTYTKAGWAAAGVAGFGPSESVFVETGFATAPGVGRGVSESVFVEAGYAAAGGVGTGNSASVYSKTGWASAGLAGSGADVDIATEAGFATVGTVGSGVSAKVGGGKAGWAAAGLFGAGTSASIFTRTGFAVSGLVATGESASVFVETGYATVGGAGSGGSSSVYTKTGWAGTGLVGSGSDVDLAVESGFATVGSVGSGFVTRAGEIIKTGAGVCGLVGAGTSASIFDRLGNAVAGTVGSGASSSVYAKSGYATAGLVGAGPSESIYQETGSLLDAATVFLLHADGPDGSTAFRDVLNHSLTANGNAQIDTAQSVFGSSSALFDGLGDGISAPASADWTLGAGNFTIDCWVRFSNLVANDETLVAQAGAAPNIAWWFSWAGASNNLRFTWSVDGINQAGNLLAAWTPVINTWYHVAVVRTGNTLLGFVNGAQVGTTAITGTIFTSTDLLMIGARSNLTNLLYGWLDEVRISKGIARWSSNFTPPTTPYGTDAFVVGTKGFGSSASIYQETGPGVVGAVGSGSVTKSGGAIKTGFATAGLVASGGKVHEIVKAGFAAAGTTATGHRNTALGKAGSASAALTARGTKAVIYTQAGYAIVSGTGSGIRIRQIQKTGVGFLGVSGYGDNTEHFDPERPGRIVGSYTGAPNHSTTGRRTVSIATILATSRNGRLTRSKTGELV